MKNLLNPKWLIIINTIPVIILSLIFYNEFNIIKTLLEEDNLQVWYNFSLSLFLLSIIHLFYSIYSILRKKEISIYYGFGALIIYTLFLYTYSCYSSDIIPWNIPRWMLSGDLFLYVGTFIMPTLVHALFVIVLKLTSKEKEHKAWKNFLLSLSIPLFTYLFSQITLPLYKLVDYRFGQHILIIGIIVCVILFLFFLIRSVYILAVKKKKKQTRIHLIIKYIVAIIFPLLGLALNNGLISSYVNGVFGNFNSPWFYGIALVNGILLCLPIFKNKKHRLLLFISKSITFSYTLYFFIVFLPFLPLSVIAIIAIGTGFLMLTPLVLFIIHIQELFKDFTFLQTHYSKNLLISLSLISFMIFPLGITVSYTKDKHILHEALNYIYTPDYSKKYDIDKSSLTKTLSIIKENKNGRSSFITGSQTPYLSPFFKWLVLDNLTISDTKINTIEKIFFNTKPLNLRSEQLRNKDVEISAIKSNSTYNEEDQSWTSWIDLEITNANKNNFTSEYATTIDLPNGCWINDYYLYVGDKKEMGVLTEKKSAMWVFSQIRNINRDPGLLHYLSGNKVSFRVFPFAKNEIRKTGIQFIHKDPVTITIDNHKLILGEQKTTSIDTKNNNHVLYISTKEKENLTKVKRTPYYHFIVDTSKNKDSLIDNYINTINTFLNKNELNTKNAKISFTNSYTSTQSFKTNWTNELKTQNFEGGFYLERAIKKVLFNSYTNLSDSYPIIIVVTNNMLDAIINKDFADFKITYPENHFFYHLNTLGYLASHDLDKTPKQFIKDNTKIVFKNEVLAWPNIQNPKAYLPNNNQPSIVLNSLNFELNPNTIEYSNWNTGLQMQGKWLSDILYPKQAENNWKNAVKMSFKSKIMTPLTSYIVVETEAQKAVLLKKQKEVLAGKKSLDLNERTQRMSEPKFYILLLFGLFLFWRQKNII